MEPIEAKHYSTKQVIALIIGMGVPAASWPISKASQIVSLLQRQPFSSINVFNLVPGYQGSTTAISMGKYFKNLDPIRGRRQPFISPPTISHQAWRPKRTTMGKIASTGVNGSAFT